MLFIQIWVDGSFTALKKQQINSKFLQIYVGMNKPINKPLCLQMRYGGLEWFFCFFDFRLVGAKIIAWMDNSKSNQMTQQLVCGWCSIKI